MMKLPTLMIGCTGHSTYGLSSGLRRTIFLALLCLCVLLVSLLDWSAQVQAQPCGDAYIANWTSLDTRPNPSWYDESKFGIFIHWGVYSVPSWAVPGPCCPNPTENPYAEWYWYSMSNSSYATYKFHVETYGADFTYQEFAPMFTASLFEPDEWADLFKASGAKYVVLTSKHHEGYTLWKSNQSWNWNSVDVGPQIDVVQVLSDSIRAVGLEFGLYYSLYEWFNPIYLSAPKTYISEVMMPQMYDIINTYKPSILWGDGCDDYSSDYWGTPDFIAWLYNESPVCENIVINDRWGNDTQWKHGGFYTSEEEWPSPTKFGDHKWEDNRGMAWSYGYNRMENITFYYPPSWYINLLVELVAKGGNLLLDVGPTHDGIIPPIMQNILLEMGAWLNVNGEAIYGTEKWRVQVEPVYNNTVFYTWNTNQSTLYAIFTSWPDNNQLILSSPEPVPPSTVIQFVGLPNAKLNWSYDSTTGFNITLPYLTPNQYPCKYTYALALSNVQ
eukprot:TRINITY_DN3695_c0_g1_i2.p1 TRINITY_DN3695_c0_g1~~TRINITY_DN3695_c0_g1_i2.p1  ORF type:complete len:499 (+),score=81.47 TRINITY_DN3695_c0_g1_i2:107-1603(+)